MLEGGTSSPDLGVRLVAASPDDTHAVQAAIRLGNAARSTLGHLPYSAYFQAAAGGTLLLALLGDQIVGYALYRLARGRVGLTHLCVASTYQGRGIARQMVGRISQVHSDYLGIAVRCRHDYGLGRMWARLGFAQRGEGPGRSKEGHPVVDWWRDHGHPHLFTPDPDTVLVRAAVDLNILRDLVQPERHDRLEAEALLADHLVGRLQLIRTPALNGEIAGMEGELRERCTRQAQPLADARPDPGQVSYIAAILQTAARQVDPNYPASPQDHYDLGYVADAIACELNVFVTRDEHLMRILGSAAARHGLRIMRPGDVVTYLDELLRAEAYRPAELHHTTYTLQLIRSHRDHDLQPLVSTSDGERPRNLVRRLENLAGSRQDRLGIMNADGDLVALLSTNACDDSLEVSLLRVANRSPADTLARQMLFYLRQQARDAGCPVMRITDPYLSAQLRRAAFADGFQTVGEHLVAFTLGVVDEAEQVNAQAAAAARRASLAEPPPLRSSMPAVVAAEIERVWWPVKIIDSRLPTYLIPIQQTYSSELLGVPTSLLPRRDDLGLSREHVYYRSPQGPSLTAPARLLWYMSKGGPSTPTSAGIVACSQLELVADGTPEELHRRFQHLGVWNEQTINAAAHGGRAQALRFTNTELFPTQVPLGTFQRLAQAHGASTHPPQGPRIIPTALFAATYQEGRTT